MAANFSTDAAQEPIRRDSAEIHVSPDIFTARRG